MKNEFQDFRRKTDEDLRMHGLSKYQLRFRWTRPEVYVVRMLRRVELLHRLKGANPFIGAVYYFQRWRYFKLCSRTGTTLPLGVFAEGLSIAHIGTVTVNSQARVGRGCRLHPGVTIGATRGIAPQLGDDVFIGPNAVLVGNILVGDRVHIGPGAIVTADVPADTLVMASVPVTRQRVRATWQADRRESVPSDSTGSLSKPTAKR